METGKQFIEKLGNFSKIDNILKRNSRIGQFFSTCKHICDLKESELMAKGECPDIHRNESCFTDGIGKMSPKIACLIAS